MNRAIQTVIAAVALSMLPLAGIAFTALQDPPPAQNQNPPASQDQDAASKAAARKKRFEEIKKQLENQNPEPPASAQGQPGADAAAKPAVKQGRPSNVVSSMDVRLTVGWTQRFFLYDDTVTPPNVTSQARWTTVDDDSAAYFYVADGVPNVVGRQVGVLSLFGTFGGRTSEVRITVLTQKEAEGGKAGWHQPPPGQIPSFHIAPALTFRGERRKP